MIPYRFPKLELLFFCKIYDEIAELSVRNHVGFYGWKIKAANLKKSQTKARRAGIFLNSQLLFLVLALFDLEKKIRRIGNVSNRMIFSKSNKRFCQSKIVSPTGLIKRKKRKAFYGFSLRGTKGLFVRVNHLSMFPIPTDKSAKIAATCLLTFVCSPATTDWYIITRDFLKNFQKILLFL